PGSNSPANFDFLNVILTTTSGQITEATFAFDPVNNRFTVLDKSTVTSVALTPAQNIAKINVIVADNGAAPFNPATDGTAFGVTADWLEGNATSPRFDNVIINGDTDSPISHTYLSNPEPNPADDIPMVVYVTNLAGGTIQPTIGGRQLVGTPDAAGQLP